MKVLIKVGGTLLDSAKTRQAVACQLAEIAREYELVVVHGGGKQVTRFLEERGISSRFISGLRVSDEPVIDAVTKVIAGTVNKQLVSAIIAAGESAVGLSGADGPLVHAAALDPQLGFVGHPDRVDGSLLELLINAGYVPVIACIAADSEGNIYNVNADQMAVSCALGWHSDTLIFLTDVEGVKNQHGQIIRQLGLQEIRSLIQSGAASAGMRAKLDAADHALRSGIQRVLIASGHHPGICRRLLAGEPLGTRLSIQPELVKGIAQ